MGLNNVTPVGIGPDDIDGSAHGSSEELFFICGRAAVVILCQTGGVCGCRHSLKSKATSTMLRISLIWMSWLVDTVMTG